MRSLLLAVLLASTASAATLKRGVFGWYPYWSQTSGTAGWRWDLLTHVGYFDADLDATGTVTSWHGWKSGPGADLVAEAHGHGVKVILTVACFGSSTIHGALTTGHDAAIASLVDGVVSVGGDGIDLDFEGMGSADRDALTTFTTDLAAALRAQIPGAHVSLAMPSVDWSNAYDYVGLAAVADALIIMGYDYHWGSSDPGPVAPLTSGTLWSSYDETWSVDDYLTKLGTSARAKVWLAMPLYGYDYPSTSDVVPGTKRGSAAAVFWSYTETQAQTIGRKWDDASQTPYYEYDGSDGWHQVWYDDAQSFGLKLDLANDRDLGGIGLWALGYESQSMWDTIDSHLTVVDMPPDAGVTPPMQTGGDLTGGCGCSAGGRAAGWPLVLGLLFLRRRRR